MTNRNESQNVISLDTNILILVIEYVGLDFSNFLKFTGWSSVINGVYIKHKKNTVFF